MGSPFFVEIYDPNKIRVEGMRTGMVNERMEFDSKSSSQFVFRCYFSILHLIFYDWQQLVMLLQKIQVPGPEILRYWST